MTLATTTVNFMGLGFTPAQANFLVNGLPAKADLTLGAITTTSIGTTGASTATSYASTGNITAGGYVLESVGNALTAAGTNRATGLQLAAQINNVTTAAASTGVVLPVGVVGMIIVLFNAGASPLQVYATASETIDGTAGSTGVALANAKRCLYMFVAANTWISAQLGVVSA